MFQEDERPRPPPGFQPAKLEGWSEEALRDYVAALREEITRAEAAIAARAKQRDAAEAFFRKT